MIDKKDFIIEVVQASDRQLLEFITLELGRQAYLRSENWEVVLNVLKASKEETLN